MLLLLLLLFVFWEILRSCSNFSILVWICSRKKYPEVSQELPTSPGIPKAEPSRCTCSRSCNLRARHHWIRPGLLKSSCPTKSFSPDPSRSMWRGSTSFCDQIKSGKYRHGMNKVIEIFIFSKTLWYLSYFFKYIIQGWIAMSYNKYFLIGKVSVQISDGLNSHVGFSWTGWTYNQSEALLKNSELVRWNHHSVGR